MTAKEYLQQIKIKNAQIDTLQRDKEALNAMLYSIASTSFGTDKVQTSTSGDKFGSLYAKIDEKEREIAKKIDELVDFKLKVTAQINVLSDDRYIHVLYRRYVLCQTWTQISCDMGYNIRYIQVIHGHALTEFYNLFYEAIP